MIYNKRCEQMDREELTQLQIEKLQSILYRAYRNVSFYKNMFNSHKVNIEEIKNLSAVRGLPFTTKADLRDSYPYDMFAVPLRDIVRIHSTTGATGQPIVVGYTKNDLRNWTECVARLLAAAGINEHDVVQISFPYTLFTGGFGFHQGAEKIGASVIPSSSTTSLEKQITIMRDFKTTCLICTPSYALSIASELQKQNIHPEKLQLKTGLFGAEPWTETLRRQIEEKLRITAIDNYGLTEIMGPGVAGECEYKKGLHVNEDHFIIEVINPETLEPVETGEEGELVFTTITKEGFPLIRYRTGDVSALLEGECPCGRSFARIKKVTGRTDDMIFFEGEGIFPSHIKNVLDDIVGTGSNFQIILEKEGAIDKMEIKVELSGDTPSIDELRTIENLRKTISSRVKTEFGIQVKVAFVEPKSLQTGNDQKVQRVVDKR